MALQFHQRNQEIQINFSGFCAKFQKIVKSMQSINKHADLWTNIYIFHLTTSPNSQITPYRKKSANSTQVSPDRRDWWTSPVKWSKKTVYKKSTCAFAKRRFDKWSPTIAWHVNIWMILNYYQCKKKKNLVFHIRRLPYD